MITCWTCDQPGHTAATCPHAAALARPAWPPPVPPRAPATAPTTGYLEERQRLGIASSGPAVLSVPCPWCESPRWRRCVNTGTGRETDPHYARQVEAKADIPSIRLRELALAQVAESRAGRLA